MNIIYKILGLIYGLIIALSILFVIALFNIFSDKYCRSIRRAWAKFVLKICFIKIELIGEFNPNAQIIMMNHASILDIIALEAIHPANLCWMAKKEIGDLPVFGQIITKPKMISIDRKNAREFINTIKEAKERIDSNRVLAIFPEGTRGDGFKLGRFKKGASVLLDKLNLTPEYAVIAGTRNAMDSKGGALIKPFSKIIIKILKPSEDIENNMQASLDELNAKLGLNK